MVSKVINWSIVKKGEKEMIVLSAEIQGVNDLIEIDLPENIYNEIVSSGPPTEDKKIRDLIDKIHEIRNKRLLLVDEVLEKEEKLLEHMDDIRDEIKDARDSLKDSKDKLEVSIWKGVLDSCNADLQIITKTKGVLQEYRHLIKLTHQEEGKLRSELVNKLRS